MDANKRQVLEDIGYRIQPTCGGCSHSSFPSDEWGTCDRHSYEHLKHTGERRHLSVHSSGYCPWFEPTESWELGAYVEFVSGIA